MHTTASGVGGGRGQLFMFSMFIIFIIGFTFFKNIIKRDKEIKQQHENALRKEFAMIATEQRLRFELQQKHEQELQRQQNIINRMKKNPNVCYDMHVFVFRPVREDTIVMTTNDARHPLSIKSPKKRLYSNSDETEEQMKARRGMISGPIVYLFVIVLTYSLIKAATEITQNLRKKAADDTKNRRCSLQRYASVKHHDNNRRNSKGTNHKKVLQAK